MKPGVQVVVSKALPLRPSPGEWARRFIRHGMADVLAWLGEPVGPAPDDETHAIASGDPAATGGGLLFVSPSYAERLRESLLLDDLTSSDRATRQAAEAAWLQSHRAHRAAGREARADGQ